VKRGDAIWGVILTKETNVAYIEAYIKHMKTYHNINDLKFFAAVVRKLELSTMSKIDT
jgi:hypothetical protein